MKKRGIAMLLVVALLFVLLPETVTANAPDDEMQNLLAGKYISVMGDSISTYMGWSDSRPITGEECTYRYGEPYYGPVGSDCHNTELLVEDTWWYQAAQALGAQILVSNAGNSTGLLHASYPANANWQQYLQEMLAYKTRPYFMGADGIDPDIIALYIGSSDVRFSPSKFGTLEAVDFDTLIVGGSDGTFTYAEPATVAEAYCILLHKLQTAYPEAEIYCFTVVPSAGGYLSTCNTRLAATLPYNDMIESVAEHYGAIVVDLFEAFGLDPDRDGVASQEDFDRFKTYYHEDPHPNAAGFDVITQCFVEAILKNSKYIVPVETTAGNTEAVGVTVNHRNGTVEKTADDYVTPSGMIVDYRYSAQTVDGTHVEHYAAVNGDNTYQAEGGSEKSVETKVPDATVDIPMTDADDTQTEVDETENTANGRPEGELQTTGDLRAGEDDGIFDYTLHSVIKQGKVSVKTQSVTVKEKILSTNHSGMTYVKSDTVATEENDLILNADPFVRPQTREEVPEIAPDYEFVYIGSDQLSNFWAAYAYNQPVASYPDETPVYSDDLVSLYVGANHQIFAKRNLHLSKLYLEHRIVEATEGKIPARYESIQQFTLTNENCQILTAYCADQKTPAVEGYSYRLENLEDATYYTEEEARMIRTIANNGYWGAESGFGSMAALRERLINSGQFTEEEVAALTDGMAMTATQYAVWTFSNVMDQKTFVSTYHANASGVQPTIVDEEATALIFKLYRYLTNLPPTMVGASGATARSIIINEKNFVKRISLNVKEKPREHPANLDGDDTNDAYYMDVSFTLAVIPSTANGDNLVLKIENAQGDCVAIGRIAGTLQEGEVMLENEHGEYIFENVLLSEGIESMRFVLTGTQYLEKTPHLLTSEVKDGVASQTMVCVAEGDRNVNISMGVSFELCVDDEEISAQRVWRTEKEIPLPPTTEPTTEPTTAPTTEPTTAPTTAPTTSPTTEPTAVPTTHPPKNPDFPETGDTRNVILWWSLLLFSILGLAVLLYAGKKATYKGKYWNP